MAKNCYDRAILQDDTNAMVHMGSLMERGVGGPVNYQVPISPPPPTLYIHNNAHSQHKHIKHTTTTNNYNTSLIHSLTHSLTRFAQTNRKPKYGMKAQ